MTDQKPDATAAADRIANYLRLLPGTVNLGAEFAYSPEFRSEEWPHDGYALTRGDVEAVLAAREALLAQLEEARGELAALDRVVTDGAVQYAKDLAELTTQRDQARNELAEERASRNPRLRCLLVKPDRDRDLYVGWSNSCEMPAGVWTRAEAEAYGFPPSRLDRADANGSSDLSCGDGHWDDAGFIAEQRGWLRRDRLADYARLWLDGQQDAAFDLLEPFDGESEVRRG